MQFDQTIYDDSGDYKRGSVTIALCGPQRCTIQWAANALNVYLPINAHRGLATYVHPSVDVARNLAIAEWLDESRKPDWRRSEHLFIWPSDSLIKWNAIGESMSLCTETNPVIQIGSGEGAAHCILAKSLERKDKPWFREGQWTATPVKMASHLIAVQNEFIQTEKPKDVGPAKIDGSHIFVTCLPSLGHTSLVWVAHALQLATPVASVRILALMIGREVADARTRLVESVLAIKPTPEHIFFLGDDVLPQPNQLQLLWEKMQTEKSSMMAGMYSMKYRPPIQPLLWRNTKAGWMIPGTDFQVGDLVRCAGTGLDFVMFKTEVFRRIPKPWFKTGMEYVEGRGVVIHTEDAHFYERYREATGEDVLVDTRAIAGHYNCFDGSIY